MTGIGASVRDFAAGLPGAWQDHPWGESVYKVGKKVFVFFGVPTDQPGFGFMVKLRDSHEEALAFEWVAPSGYGLTVGAGSPARSLRMRRSRCSLPGSRIAIGWWLRSA